MAGGTLDTDQLIRELKKQQACRNRQGANQYP